MSKGQLKIKKRYQFHFINVYTQRRCIVEHLFLNDSEAIKSIKNNYFNNTLERAFILKDKLKIEIKLNV